MLYIITQAIYIYIYTQYLCFRKTTRKVKKICCSVTQYSAKVLTCQKSRAMRRGMCAILCQEQPAMCVEVLGP